MGLALKVSAASQELSEYRRQRKATDHRPEHPSEEEDNSNRQCCQVALTSQVGAPISCMLPQQHCSSLHSELYGEKNSESAMWARVAPSTSPTWWCQFQVMALCWRCSGQCCSPHNKLNMFIESSLCRLELCLQHLFWRGRSPRWPAVREKGNQHKTWCFPTSLGAWQPYQQPNSSRIPIGSSVH